VDVDFINSEGDLSRYQIVVAPVLYMIKPGVAKRLEDFANQGGTVIITFFSGIVNQNDLVTLGGYPAELRKLFGIWVEEIDPLFPGMTNRIIMEEPFKSCKKEYSCSVLCDVLHLETAKALASYGEDFYKGKPVLTVNEFGKGKAYYIASDPDEEFIKDFIDNIFMLIYFNERYCVKSGAFNF
jgi:beta-galactosidase